MELQPADFLSFLQQEISVDFELDKKLHDQKSFSSKVKNLLLSWKPRNTELIITLSLFIQDSGQQFSIHLRNDVKWYSLLQNWCQVMTDYLLDQNLKLTETNSTEVANNYSKNFDSILLPRFEDPDTELNYAISKMDNIELEFLNLLNTKQGWFEISNTDDDAVENKVVRQISVPIDDKCSSGQIVQVLDEWLKLQIMDLDWSVYNKFKSKKNATNYKIQLFVIIALFIVWLLAFEWAPI
ncbi:MAG: hypothetical protein KC646_04705 [Candidatus Cloacimonetes bacterium]|nr:hypothetical protein [Candidatus Cloacimonadota bacterium]